MMLQQEGKIAGALSLSKQKGVKSGNKRGLVLGRCWESSSIALGEAVPVSAQVQMGWRELSKFCWDGFHFLMKTGSKVVSWERAWEGVLLPLIRGDIVENLPGEWTSESVENIGGLPSHLIWVIDFLLMQIKFPSPQEFYNKGLSHQLDYFCLSGWTDNSF